MPKYFVFPALDLPSFRIKQHPRLEDLLQINGQIVHFKNEHGGLPLSCRYIKITKRNELVGWRGRSPPTHLFKNYPKVSAAGLAFLGALPHSAPVYYSDSKIDRRIPRRIASEGDRNPDQYGESPP